MKNRIGRRVQENIDAPRIFRGTGASPVLRSLHNHGRGAHATTLFASFFILFVLCASVAHAAEPTVRFATIDISIDPQGQSLAAYQFELIAPESVTLVGVEGGEHDAFKKAPYYDPRALQQRRIVIAGLSTDTSLPNAKTRVARIHVEIRGNLYPDYTVKLIVAGNSDAKAIANAVVTFAPTETQQKKEQ